MTENINIFERLGIYGLDSSTESALLAGMLVGDPALLIGPPGCGKTELIGMMGAALCEYTKSLTEDKEKHFKYRLYDSSKINWEDLVGFPDVNKITKQGKMDFINTGTTIWGAHLVLFDELNRCREDRQANLFDVIRSRTLHGIPTGTKFVFGAMNPHGDTGTEMMSEALVDRFMFYVHFGVFSDMGDRDRINIITRIGNNDAVGKKTWASSSNANSKSKYDLDVGDELNERLVQAGSALRQTMEAGVEIFDELATDCGTSVAELVNRTINGIRSITLSDKSKAEISGRRAAMIYRGILSLRAVELAASRVSGRKLTDFEGSIINAFTMAMPHGVSGGLKPEDQTRIRKQATESIRSLWPKLAVAGNGVPVDCVFELFNTECPFRKMEILLNYPISALEAKDAWSRLASNDTNSDVRRILFLLSRTTEIVPQSVQIEDFSTEFQLDSRKNKTMTVTLNKELVKSKYEIDCIYATVKDDPILCYVFTKALQNHNKVVKNPRQAFEALQNLRMFTEGLRNKLGAIRHDSESLSVCSVEENPIP